MHKSIEGVGCRVNLDVELADGAGPHERGLVQGGVRERDPAEVRARQRCNDLVFAFQGFVLGVLK